MVKPLETTMITVYGTSWCPDCTQAKQLLDKRGVPYRWVDIEKDSEAMAYVMQLNNGLRRVPTIVFPDGSILVEPTIAALGGKIELMRLP